MAHTVIEGVTVIPGDGRDAITDAIVALDVYGRVVNENIAVGEEQDFGFAEVAALVPPGGPQPPSDLERYRGLSRARA